MKFDKLANTYLKVLSEGYDDYDLDDEGRVKPFSTARHLKGPFSLYWKDEEYGKSRKWFKANTLGELIDQVNKYNTPGNERCLDENKPHGFESEADLIEFCQPESSNFIIVDGAGKPVTTEIL